MTLARALRIVLRRWYVMAAVLAITVWGFWWQLESAGVYSAQPLLTFVSPDTTQISSAPDWDADTLTSFAFGVVTQFNSGRELIPLASSSPPLYGIGVRKDVQVAVSNSGNQWMSVYGQPVVDIQVVGPSAAWVSARMRSTIATLSKLSDSAQDSAGVTAANRIALDVQPLSDGIEHVYPGRSAKLIAAASFAAAGIGAGAALCVWLDALIDHLSARRSDRRRRTSPLPTR